MLTCRLHKELALLTAG